MPTSNEATKQQEDCHKPIGEVCYQIGSGMTMDKLIHRAMALNLKHILGMLWTVHESSGERHIEGELGYDSNGDMEANAVYLTYRSSVRERSHTLSLQFVWRDSPAVGAMK